MKTLVVFTGGVGDTLLAGPAFATLHAKSPLDLAGNTERIALIQAAGACNEIFDLDRIEFHSIFNETSPKFREFIRNYDRVIVWMRDDGAIERAVRECGIASVDVYPGLPPDDWTRHASKYYIGCVVDSARAEPPLPIRIPLQDGATPAKSKHDVLIHPGSGSPKKNWPIENFLAVANALQSAGHEVAWLRGPAEDEIEYPPNAAIVRAKNLLDLANDLSQTRLYIGNDSGVTHLAATVDCKTVAVFGPTNPAIWAPIGRNVRAVQRAPWPSPGIVTDAALNALESPRRSED